MDEPKIDYDKKIIEYQGIKYKIIGSDTRVEMGTGRTDMCTVGEYDIERKKYLIWLSGYKDGEVIGLDENDCLILDDAPYITLRNAILDACGIKK